MRCPLGVLMFARVLLMLDSNEIAVVTGMVEKDVRFIADLLFDRTELNIDETIVFATFQLLRSLGFNWNDCIAITKHFKSTLCRIPATARASKNGLPMTVMNIADNRFVSIGLGKDNKVFDLKEKVTVEHFPLPLVSVMIVLTKLYRHVASTLLDHLGQRFVKEETQSVVQVLEAALLPIRQPEFASVAGDPNSSCNRSDQQ